MKEKTCIKCNGNLKEGMFYVRNDDKAHLFNFTVWIETKKEEYIKTVIEKKGYQYPIIPYRCVNCGIIEFYAINKEEWKG